MNESAGASLAPHFREKLDGPTGQVVGIPGDWYWREEFFQLERERLFARTWVFAGYAHELPESGDAVPAEVAGFGVILTRNQSGSIRAYHNVCPHRGMYLLDKPLKNAPVIKCPYHGWAFDMDGALKSTPHWGGFKSHHLDGFDPSCHGMKSLRCEQWHDWVFVNIDGEAPPFAEHMAAFESYFSEYDLQSLVHTETRCYEMKANWKIVQENFIEVLHLPPIHARLSAYAPFHEHAVIANGNCVGTIIETGLPATWARQPLPRYPGIGADSRTAKNLLLFPTFKLVIGPDHCCSMIEFPVNAGFTRQRWDFYFLGEGALDPVYEPTRREIIDFFCETNEEDLGAVEGLQRGRHSTGFDGGVLSEVWEGAVHQFFRLNLNYMN